MRHLTNISPSVFCTVYRGAVPVSLLEDFLAAFHQRMLERMRVAGLDNPPRPFLSQNETSESIDAAVEDESSVGSSPRSIEGAKSKSSQIGMSMQPEDGRDFRSCWSELSKGAEKECTGGADTASAGTTACTPTDKNLKSVGRPLGDRDINSRDSQAQPGCQGYTTKRRGDRVSRTPPKSGNMTTLIHDPFSLDERRRLTTDTAQYKHWASFSRLVHDVRQDTRL